MPALEDFRRVLKFFNTLKEESSISDYAIIGGLALSAWIAPRTTQDIDLVVTASPGLKSKDLAYLVETRLRKKTHQPKMKANYAIKEMFSFTEDHLGVDVIFTAGFQLAEEAIREAASIEVVGEPVKLATPEYLIALKLVSFDDKDKLDIKNLLAVADLATVKAIAAKHGLSESLATILSSQQ